LELNDFQELCTTTAIYPKDVGIEYCALGLVSEVGEVAGKMKKFLRGDFTIDVLIDGMYRELGDVLWYVAMLAEELDVPLDDLAADVLSKLQARKAAGTIKGDGDNR
jgi:NTP pyrophosphatase (non-canonical NTP hydrolase)